MSALAPPVLAEAPLSAPVSYTEPSPGYAPAGSVRYADMPRNYGDSPSAPPADPAAGYDDAAPGQYADMAPGYSYLEAPPATPASLPRRSGPDELFRAWQGSVRAAAAPRAPWAAPRRQRPVGRRRARQAAAVGVPALVIVAVGAGAVLMLTGRANDMLAERSSGTAVSAAASGFSASLGPAATLPGYPGRPGQVAVAAMWPAGGVTLAAGTADGHPALWRRAAGGGWSLVPGALLSGVTGHLTGVTHGPLGWVAVGSAQIGGQVQPVLYQSADAVTWTRQAALTALSGDGAQFLAVTASSGGYVVAGRAGGAGGNGAALWWSANLTSWTAAAGSGHPDSYAAAAVAVPGGFAAVGAALGYPVIWTSPDGQAWTAHDPGRPDGATSATLRSVAAGAGGRLVAAGYAVTPAGDLPLVVTSADGARFTQVVLSSTSGPATVTAVTATSRGFVAVGLAGPAHRQQAVTWTSRDGLTWSPATALSAAGGSEVTALTVTDPSSAAPAVTGTAWDGARTTLLAIPAG